MKPELDIVTWFREPPDNSLSSLNACNKSLFELGMNLNREGFFLSLFTVPAEQFTTLFPGYSADEEQAVLLRSVFMKPEHEKWADTLAELIFSAAGA